MSRTPNTNAGGWLPLWNSNSSNISNSTTYEEGIEANQLNMGNHKSGPGSPGKTESGSSTLGITKKRQSLVSTKTLKHKASTTSLVSMSAGHWLNWPSKVNKENNDDLDNGQTSEENEEAVGEEQGNEDENNDYLLDDNGDDIDDHVPQIRKKSSSSAWSFWNATNYNNDGDNHSNKNRDKKISITNTILNSTPSIPTKQDIINNSTNKNTKLDKANDSDDNSTPPPATDKSSQDDAVLYKPHDNAKQFSQINTHKNENLRENVIVPHWDSCLPHQSLASSVASSLTSSIFSNSSTANQSNSSSYKIDLKNWRHFLNQLSTRLGFGSQSLTSVVQADSNADGAPQDLKQVEKEFNLLYERTYRLYGRCLAKLPNHKRGCLPNYNKFYAKSSPEEETYEYQQQTQLEEDSNDPNSISITNDPMGHLLINQKPSKNNKQSRAINSSNIISHKSGPLNKIKKILIIGVHGFFPTKMIRPIIGSPKGTSLKFANEAEKAIIRYCVENNLINETESNVSIQKIALEKEGKIFDRVKFFTEILTKWQEELNNADFIFVAAHSQGCVVSIILLAKLIEMGILKDPIRKRIGILGMAGINNGPFYGVDKSLFMKAYSAIEHDSLIELFELTKFPSQQSLVYKKSVQIIINANVKICFIGSINDQLVPLYSALASHVFHPNIYRACYIDHTSQTPLFIQKLVSLCCQLQNLGYFDNNVLKELSTSLAGPLTGGGHSKIYNDGKVYDLGIKFVLDTDDIVIPATRSTTLFVKDLPFSNAVRGSSSSNNGTHNSTETSLSNEMEEIAKLPVTNQVYIKEYNVGKIGTNPFILPWCLRGLLFNIEKNWPNNNKLISVDSGNDLGKNGYDEINELYELFGHWKPDSKVLKDLKFRLNGLRVSKL